MPKSKSQQLKIPKRGRSPRDMYTSYFLFWDDGSIHLSWPFTGGVGLKIFFTYWIRLLDEFRGPETTKKCFFRIGKKWRRFICILFKPLTMLAMAISILAHSLLLPPPSSHPPFLYLSLCFCLVSPFNIFFIR